MACAEAEGETLEEEDVHRKRVSVPWGLVLKASSGWAEETTPATATRP